MKNLEGKTAVLYMRVSTKEQKIHGNSLEVQKSRLKSFCERKNVQVIKEFTDEASAKTLDRPGFNMLLNFVKKNSKKTNYVLVIKIDRLTRNVEDGFKIIAVFKSMNVEVNAIDEWRDHNNPLDFFPNLMSLGVAQYDNILRSSRTIDGNREAIKEGRYPHTRPQGYKKSYNEFNKYIIVPDENAPLIKALFEKFATGLYSKSDLVKDPMFKRLKLNKNKVFRILTKKIYTGIIELKAHGDEQYQEIVGVHEPIVSPELFDKVQRINHNVKIFQKPKKKESESFPLRGYLLCKKCNSPLTGSTSLNKNKQPYSYYHCQPKNECGERFNVNYAHDSLSKLLSSLKSKKEVVELFSVILENKIKNSKISKQVELNKIDKELELLINKKQGLITLRTNNEITRDELREMKESVDKKTYELQGLKESLSTIEDKVLKHVKFGAKLLCNLDYVFKKASNKTKKKILCSIFENYLVFDKNKYRTPELKEVIKLITSNSLGLKAISKKREESKTTFSHSVHYAVNLSNSFIEDLEKVGKFYEKHKSYIKSKSKKTLEEV